MFQIVYVHFAVLVSQLYLTAEFSYKLVGNNVRATDLRCGAGLIIAALMAEGETVIDDAYHIFRGYSNIVEKLSLLGADVQKI